MKVCRKSRCRVKFIVRTYEKDIEDGLAMTSKNTSAAICGKITVALRPFSCVQQSANAKAEADDDKSAEAWETTEDFPR